MRILRIRAQSYDAIYFIVEFLRQFITSSLFNYDKGEVPSGKKLLRFKWLQLIATQITFYCILSNEIFIIIFTYLRVRS